MRATRDTQSGKDLDVITKRKRQALYEVRHDIKSVTLKNTPRRSGSTTHYGKTQGTTTFEDFSQTVSAFITKPLNSSKSKHEIYTNQLIHIPHLPTVRKILVGAAR